ncbi:DNA-3-methyladenine glycosylase I [Snodgrassella sp. CFCC 13594]|uniref:DNA-3-methyladenine glycosylase I n=1 Tax=Snodgrassella sp. CFCC 13594 TaxID=1775559 RepID=UPI000833F701|nr:DNA-3-methyladenine glycosylase I [Snodgrassella sp. CFCC 13594]
MSYCSWVAQLADDSDNPNRHYHDHSYGFPIANDNELFERLVLEINQAGLSWTLMLKKQAAFQAAYADFDVARVAAFGDQDIARLLADAGIVRNRLKVQAAVYNAQKILCLQAEYGSFKQWLDAHHPLELAAWVKLFRSQFKFVGGEIVHEFLMSTGYLPGAHTPDCPVYARVISARPPWWSK